MSLMTSEASLGPTGSGSGPNLVNTDLCPVKPRYLQSQTNNITPPDYYEQRLDSHTFDSPIHFKPIYLLHSYVILFYTIIIENRLYIHINRFVYVRNIYFSSPLFLSLN